MTLQIPYATGASSGLVVPTNPLASLEELEKRIAALERLTADTGWITPASFEHGWKAVQSVGYRRVGNIVRLRGRVTGGTNGTTAFILPAGFVPAQFSQYATAGAGPAFSCVTVYESGAVYIYNPSSAEGIALDVVTFSLT
jgi:hypothetical protein